MLRFVSSFPVLLLTVCGLCGSVFLKAQNASQQDLKRLVAEPLPEGSVAQSPPTFYSPDNLYEYMDGGADIFVLYGVKTMLHLDAKAHAVDVTVDVFDMGSPNTAFGMYAAERSPDYNFIRMGAEGYRNTGILNFVQDRYYIKLAGFGEGADAVLDAWAKVLSARIGSNTSLPEMLARLPSGNRVPHSEQYIPKDPLGHSFLGPAYVASYAFDGHESKLFVTLAHSDSDALERMKQLEAHFAKTGEYAPAPDIEEGAIRGKNSFEGAFIAKAQGHFLIVIMNPTAGSEQIFRAAAKSLH
ncbi:MAG TPA: DUF6599 family protein [Terracidiphilus sp.]|nr:DUF6599 family protein [Terracidiphilus sp.]